MHFVAFTILLSKKKHIWTKHVSLTRKSLFVSKGKFFLAALYTAQASHVAKL